MKSAAYDRAMKHINKAERLVHRGRLQESIALYRKGLKLIPENADVLNNFANVLTSLKRFDEAIVIFRKAIHYDPKSPQAHANLGSALASLGQYHNAIVECQRALEVDPAFYAVYGLLGFWLSNLGRNEQALEYLQQAVEQLPHDRWIYSLYLLVSNYSDRIEPQTQFEVHRNWYRNFFINSTDIQQVFADQLNNHRPLNVGYVSADFRHHSVAFFIEPVLKGHDRTQVKCFCYSNNSQDDEVTQRLKKACDVWHSVISLDDEQLYEIIRKDRIDILVDLSGHTGGNRLSAFARKPAPLQVTYLGYPNTTGMDVMDYRITDEVADPTSIVDEFYAEKLVRLRNGFLCYSPPNAISHTNEAPCVKQGFVTFGSFNNISKLSPTTIRLWAEVLNHTPDSRLLLKGKAFNDTQACDYFIQQFEAQGITAERLRLLAYAKNFAQHMALYDEIDIGLDSYPYNGATTTFEALWMGVPMISRAGQTHNSRVGKSIMTVLGLENLVANNDESFVQIATHLAANSDVLTQYRRTLRERLQSSPLMDEAGFVNKLEQAYQTMWQELLTKSALSNNIDSI